MKRVSSLAVAMATGVSAIGTLNYTDSFSGMSFSGYTDGDFVTGIALPDDPTTDLIVQIIGPANNSAGWGGFDFGTEMADRLLIIAWPNGDDVVVSAREATTYATPPVYSGNVTLYPIASGTYVNSTHYSATVLCSGCITGDDTTFSASDTEGTFGYAYSTTAVTDASDSSTALSYHSAGFGAWGMPLAYAMSSDYATWAATASTTASGSTISNSTTSSNTTIVATTSNTTYDYIIAGAGPAGVIVAARLAETGASVLLLERGEASLYSTGGTSVVSWNSTVTQYDVPAEDYYLTTASDTSEYCTDTAGMAGCILGGGGMVNAIMFVLPQDKDFDDNWPTGWQSADMQDATERLLARNPVTDLPSADGQRYDQDAYDILSDFLTTNGFSNVSAITDVNAKVDTFAHPPWNIQNGTRSGPVKTYLPVVQDLENFQLSLNAKVVRAVRNGTWVSGVEIELEDGSYEIVNVTPSTGKVILAAGSMSTPRILIYSGIGPSDQIELVPSEIPLPDESEWIDLPVGKGIKDHPILTVTLGTKTSLTALASTNFTSPDDESVSLWSEGSGLLVQSGQRLNFWTSVVSPSDNGTRFLQGTCNSPSDDTIRIKLYVTHGSTSSGDLVLDTTGTVTEFSTEPWLTTQGDIEAYEQFFDRLIAMSAAENSTLTLQLADGSDAPSNITGAALYQDLYSTLTDGDHFVGTAKMGTDDGRTDNGTAVVDLNTQVYGTDNLFVVDASIHPDLPTGNTQAIIMVVAEQAAAKILALDGQSIANGTATSTTTSSAAGASATISKCKRAAMDARALQIRGSLEHSMYAKGLSSA
ncbi:cellobiose dehydrogenase [Xylariales sp. PMI_506]|nr:cellobiose dehydrogenase [Xylariales sp. PMI_506]